MTGYREIRYRIIGHEYIVLWEPDHVMFRPRKVRNSAVHLLSFARLTDYRRLH